MAKTSAHRSQPAVARAVPGRQERGRPEHSESALPGPELPSFLRKLAKHNDREWFRANAPTYTKVVHEPLLAFGQAVAQAMGRPRPAFDFGRAAMTRPWRDPRFGAGPPLHESAYLRFREVSTRADRVHFGVRFTATGVLLDAGYRPASADGRRVVRETIAERPQVAMRVLSIEPLGAAARGVRTSASSTFSWLDGHDPQLVRMPRGLACAELVADLIRHQAWTRRAVCSTRGMNWSELPERVAIAFAAALPFVRYLARALDKMPQES